MSVTENCSQKKIKYLVADTTAFIQNATLQEIASNVVTCKDVVNEIINKRQLRRLVVLPYDLVIKEVFPENIKVVTEFSRKTGDYPSLSATDIKVIALAYQLEKEKVGTAHIRTEPLVQRSVNIITNKSVAELKADTVGFYLPEKNKNDKHKFDTDLTDRSKDVLENVVSENSSSSDIQESETLLQRFAALDIDASNFTTDDTNALIEIESEDENAAVSDEENKREDDDDDDDLGWITPSNIQNAKKQINYTNTEEKEVTVACMTTDFAMQNVLKQMNLNISALDGRVIKHLRTYILRCYTCFKTTSEMTRIFCPKCGNKTLKRVGVSVDENGKQVIHINARKPLTGRGKKFSLPRIKGGKHSNNPHLVADQPFPDQRPSRLAKTKNNPLDDDYIAGFSPFVMRDINSKSAQLKIRPNSEVKYWMRRNPNEVMKRKK
ncbi:RNA-binding protein NOB1 [Agrilus planipennis]|uniref:RNA-binding protein NOB1 n=1 Tax=Agrilus planipennis TaxID=224129 RepID=A0A7F5RD95_AGRPL|nr:RNA-binding protein NOB1 [Agrilus planipennis]